MVMKMKTFIKLMSLMLLILLVVSFAIACENKGDDSDTPTHVITTTAEDTTTPKNTTANTTTAEVTTTTNDGWGPLTPLDTGKNN